MQTPHDDETEVQGQVFHTEKAKHSVSEEEVDITQNTMQSN
ncbi:MAG: hypothetical protein ABIQ11_06380 [Saprospiraceae bacterium]